jgi:hypothetical protein
MWMGDDFDGNFDGEAHDLSSLSIDEMERLGSSHKFNKERARQAVDKGKPNKDSTTQTAQTKANQR